MKYSIDEYVYDGTKIRFSGWGAPESPEDTLTVKLLDAEGKDTGTAFTRANRPDVAEAVYGVRKNGMYGFSFTYSDPEFRTVTLVLSASENKTDCLSVPLVLSEKLSEYRKSKSFLRKCKRFLKSDDRAHFAIYEKYRLLSDKEKRYPMWYDLNFPGKKELLSHKAEVFPVSPKFSIAVPVFRPVKKHLQEMVQSVLSQTYGNFELILANGSPDHRETGQMLSALSKSDQRIRVVTLSENLGIAGNTNAAMSASEGEWIALLDQDDLLHPDALYEFVRAINQKPDCKLLYSDEDKLDDETGFHRDPFFKPDYNPAWLHCNNYICHFLAFRRSLLTEAGEERPEYDGAQDFDFVLRLTECAEGAICHVPHVLYSWRIHSLSTAAALENKDYAIAAGVRALEEAYARQGRKAKAYPIPNLPGRFRTEVALNSEPLVSVIIPNKDHVDDLKRCLDSLYEKSSYRNFEVLVVENNSTDPETFRYYEKIGKTLPGLRVLQYPDAFNYAAIQNFAAREASGEYLLLLNNDTEVITDTFLYGMLSFMEDQKVAAVGAKLLYPDNTVQHAGVLVLTEGAAHHVYLGAHDEYPGYMGRLQVACNVSAVTGACMLVKASAYREVSGMDEDLRVAYNDVDLCLKLLDAGYLVVYDAFDKLYHYESKSRGYEDTEEKKRRQLEEAAILSKKHPDRVGHDPYYNPNLSMKNGYYELP